jgi:hypothetical protein
VSGTLDLSLVLRRVGEAQTDIRAIKRDLAMLRAQQSELPTVAQFQAGLTDIDARMTDLHNEIMAAIAKLTAVVLKDTP